MLTPPASDVNVPTVTLSAPEQEAYPPEYASSNTLTSTTTDNTSLTYPSQAHIPPSSTPSDLPTYDHAKVDMPPIYIITPEANIDSVPLDTQVPWPVTKKLYFLGFIFWPLWFIGMGFSVFGRSNKTRMWGRRCATNSVIIIILFTYLLIAYIRTHGRLK